MPIIPAPKVKYIIFSDLDGTLELSPELNKSIELLEKNNAMLVIISARSVPEVIEMCRRKGIKVGRYVIGDNGGTIYDTEKGEFLKHESMDNEAAKQLLEEFLGIGGKLKEVRFSTGKRHIVQESPEAAAYYRNNMPTFRVLVTNIRESLGQADKVTMISFRTDSPEIIEKMKQFIANLNLPLVFNTQTIAFLKEEGKPNLSIDISPMGTGKDTACEALLNILGNPEFMCAGNDSNDLSMLEYAISQGTAAVLVTGQDTERDKELIAALPGIETVSGSANAFIAEFAHSLSDPMVGSDK